VLTSVVARYGRAHLQPLEEAGFELVERFDLNDVRDVDVLVGAFDGAWATIAGGEPYSRGLLERLPGLRAIARGGVGYDAIDVAAATDTGVVVLTTPGANSDSVADWTLTLMLACLRRVLVTDQAVRDGRWRLPELAGDLAAATVGIVGLGEIGRAVAWRLSGFGCRLLAVDPNPDEVFCRKAGIELLALDELLPQVDVLTLHAPLSAETRHSIGAPELALMKPEAVLVNTSRGAAVDESALIDALKGGRLAGAGLDVFEHEPLTAEHPLSSLSNVVLSPHSASFTRLGIRRMAERVVENLMAVTTGDLPPGCVNPDAWKEAERGGAELRPRQAKDVMS
jgi:phosphoglycerate dehydrogenase-like enzyme